MVAQTGYLSVEDFKLRTIMPSEDVDRLEVEQPGYLQTKLNEFSRRVDALLRKRYSVPFVAPYPEIVCGWLADIVTFFAYGKRGFTPNSKSDYDSIVKPYETAREELQKAADAKEGLFDLPLLNTTDSTAISKGGMLSYSEASPYVWADLQRETAGEEDQ